jgi:hypothetical protein
MYPASSSEDVVSGAERAQIIAVFSMPSFEAI